MKISEFKETVRTALRERSINAISKLQQKNVENIAKALEFYKKNKHTDKREPFIKLLKKLGKEKEALAKELDMKVSGMYKNAEYKGESVNESINISEGKHDLILDKLADLVKGAKSFMDIGNQLKKQKIKYSFSTSMIPIYRLDKLPIAIVNKKYTKPNKAAGDRVVGDTVIGLMESIKESVNEMAMGFDSMTGLFYLKGVPFTKERIKEVILFMKSSKPKTSSNQFEMTSALIVKDKVNKGEVTIDSKNLKTLIEAFKRHKNLASDKDFN